MSMIKPIHETRYYDLFIIYDFSYFVPRLLFQGYSENGTMLSQE